MRKLKWLLLGAAILPSSAFAQGAPGGDQEKPATDAASPDQAQGLGDIVVTAQRRSESLQRAAIAASAISGDALVNAGVTKPTELTAVIPSLQVAPSAGPYSLFYLRGVGNFNGNALSDSAVAFNFNGVYVGRPSSTTGFFYDLDRVEVVKGPQGTLYGRNATGGAINVLPRKAQLGKFEGNAQIEYGNYDAWRGDAALNVPIGDKAALRFAGVLVRHDGYMKDGTDDQKDAGGRISFRVEPTDNLSIDIVGDYFRQRGRGVGGTPVELGVDDRPGYLSPEGQAFVGHQPNLVLGRLMDPMTIQPFLRNNFWGISSTIEWHTPAGTITFIPAYREGKLNYLTETPGFYLRQREKDKQTSFELRLASDEHQPLRYIFGAFYYDETNDVPLFYVNQQSNVNVFDYTQRTQSMAVFGRLTYAVTDSFRLTAGARYTADDKNLDGTLAARVRVCTNPTAFFPAYIPGCPTASTFPFAPSASTLPPPNFIPGADGTITIPSFVDSTGANAKRASVERVTYRLGADWDITSNNLLYASYETGFKSGGFFFTTDRGVYAPEKIEAWTLGSKNRFFNNRLQINLEAFYWRYKDQQISHLLNDSAGFTVFGTENVGRATFKGVEIESRLLVTRNTELTADVQYLDAKYNDFTYQTPNLNGGISNGTACPNVGTPGTTYTVDCSGFRPPNAPKWTINLGAKQTVPLGDAGEIVANVRAHYQSRTLTGLEFTQAETQPAYWQADAQVTYYTANDRLSVGAYMNNIFNETVIANTFPVPFTLYTSASLRPPRTYGVRVGYKF